MLISTAPLHLAALERKFVYSNVVALFGTEHATSSRFSGWGWCG
jgi:hypothetical protein